MTANPNDLPDKSPETIDVSVDMMDYRQAKPVQSQDLLFVHLYLHAPDPKKWQVQLKLFMHDPSRPVIKGRTLEKPTPYLLHPIENKYTQPLKSERGIYVYQQAVRPVHSYRIEIYEGGIDEAHLVARKTITRFKAVRDAHQPEGTKFEISIAASGSPYLPDALNETAIGPSGDIADDADAVAKILPYIEKRLVATAGSPDTSFDQVWQTPSGKRDRPYDDLEETWAQLVTERLDFSTYAGPDVFYITSMKPNQRAAADYYRQLMNDADPTYPLTSACEHTSTFVAMARGLNVVYEAGGSPSKESVDKLPGAKWNMPKDAHDDKKYPPVREYLKNKNWEETAPPLAHESWQKITPGSAVTVGIDHFFPTYQLYADAKVKPGPTMHPVPLEAGTSPAYIIQKGTKTWYELPYSIQYSPLLTYTASEVPGPTGTLITTGETGYLSSTQAKSVREAHVAAVLRVDYATQADAESQTTKRMVTRVQFMDTGGGMGIMAAAATQAVDLNGASVHQESGWGTKGRWFACTSYAGHSMLPEVKGDDLQNAIARLRRARPLGMMQLVILRRTDDAGGYKFENDVVWASKLLAMHSGDQAFTLPRLMWAMRGHPGFERYEVRWVVYIPRQNVAVEFFSNRDKALSARIADGFKELKSLPQSKNDKPKAVPLPHGTALPAEAALRIAELGSNEDGSVCMCGRPNRAGQIKGRPLAEKLAHQLAWDVETGKVKPAISSLFRPS